MDDSGSDLGDADGTSYREMADEGETDLGDADGTSYREIAREDEREADEEGESFDEEPSPPGRRTD